MKRTSSLLLKAFLGLLSLVVWTACKGDDDNSSQDIYLTLDKTEMDMNYFGDEATFQVESNTSWSIVCDDEAVTITPSQGSGNATVKVVLAVNSGNPGRDIRILVSTSNGQKTANITLHIKVGELDIANIKFLFYNSFLFDGKAGAMERAYLISDRKWQLTGPSWMEGSLDGSNWQVLTRPLTGEPATFLNPAVVYLRTTSKNDSDNPRIGELVLAEQVTGAYSTTYPISQPGRNIANPRMSVSLTNGLATDFRLGCNVSGKFYVTISDKRIYDTSEINDWVTLYEDYFYSCDNLKEGQTYYLYTKTDQSDDSYMVLDYTLPTSDGAALASIEKVYYENGTWYADTKMNTFASGYISYLLTDENWFAQPDASIAYLLNYLRADDPTWYIENYDIETEATWHWQTPGGFQFVTWASQTYNPGTMSPKISRYVNRTGSHNAPAFTPPTVEMTQGAVSAEERDAKLKELKKGLRWNRR